MINFYDDSTDNTKDRRARLVKKWNKSALELMISKVYWMTIAKMKIIKIFLPQLHKHHRKAT